MLPLGPAAGGVGGPCSNMAVTQLVGLVADLSVRMGGSSKVFPFFTDNPGLGAAAVGLAIDKV